MLNPLREFMNAQTCTKHVPWLTKVGVVREYLNELTEVEARKLYKILIGHEPHKEALLSAVHERLVLDRLDVLFNIVIDHEAQTYQGGN